MRTIESLNVKEKAGLVQEVLDKKNGVCDKDWCDIVMDYDLDCSSETLRKAGVGIKLASDAGMGFPVDGAGTRGVMDNYVERQKLYDLRREVRKDLREQSRSELIRELIRNAIRDLPDIQRCNSIPWDNGAMSDRELVVGMGDFHFGAEYCVKGLYDEAINVYDRNIFEKRLGQLMEEIVQIVRKDKPARITLMIVGDMLEGMIRTSQLSRLEYGLVESTIVLSEQLSAWISDLYNISNTPIRVYAVRGNHGEIRPLGTKAGQFPEENMERIVMHYIHERLRGHEGVTVEDDDAPMSRMVDVLGFKFLLIHGQGDDIEKIARDHLTLYNNKIDVFMCGHLHKSQTFTAGIMPGSNVLVERIPSLCGIDPYAQSRGFGSPPGATAILMEEGYGRRCVYPIVLR